MLHRDGGCVAALTAGVVAFLAMESLSRAAATTTPAGDEIVARWTFDTQADADAWTPGQHCEKLGISDGALQLRLTGPDAFIFAPALRTRMDGCAIRITMRSDRDGTTEAFFITDKRPTYSERQKAWVETPASKGFQTYDLVLGAVADTDRYLTGFRIDPYNGNRDGTVEIDSVEVVRLAPRFDIGFAAADARPSYANVTLKISAKQTAGRRCTDDIMLGVAGSPRTPHKAVRAGEAAVREAKVRVDTPGFHRFSADARLPGGATFSLETGVSRLSGGPTPGSPILGTEQIRLELVPDAGTEGRYGAARLWIAGDGGEWVDAALLQPLAAVMFQNNDATTCRCPSLKVVRLANDIVQLAGDVRVAGGGGLVAVDIQVVRDHGKDVFRVQASFVASQAGRLCKFAGPTVLAGRPGEDPLDRHAFFGGLEFLEPGWSSSSERSVGEKFARRWTPQPYKITLPVMAVEQKGVTTALMWQPARNWSRDCSRPAATFASPNFLQGQPNHLLQLFAPSVSEWTAENECWARRPYDVRKDDLIRLEYVVVAERKTPVVWMAKRWYEIFGAPEPPPAPHDAARTYELCIQNFGETMYWPDQNGWRHHMYLDQKSGFHGFMAGELLSHAARTGHDKWIKATGLAGRAIVDVLGPIANRLERSGHVQGALASQQPDGTWPFKNTPRMIEQTKEFTAGKYTDLGEDGSTSLGTTVMPALPILKHALITGDPDCARAGVKALEAMKRFRVPRGAQVWEVPQLVPDIRAAALAVEAYRMGYQLTGEERWLDEARYWAWTGVPFLYSWHVPIEDKPARVHVSRSKTDWSDRRLVPAAEGFENPSRQVTPYATIPVFGTTFYVISWFGNVVQWCGLEWAYQVMDLLEFRPDPLLKTIADGVVRSGQQQMLDREPWVGLYPDVWDLSTNSAVGAYISTVLPLQCLRARGDAPADTEIWTRVLRDSKPPLHVSGWGRLRDLTSADGRLAINVDFAPGQMNELVIVGADKPAAVSVDSRELTPALGDEHWQYRPEKRAIIVRFRQSQSLSAAVVRW